jgi:uroporphyrinogen-III synthase
LEAGKPDTMRILITSPATETVGLIAALEVRGHDVIAVPLITAERLDAPEIKLEGAQGFLVTSAEGARALADAVSVRFFPVYAESEEAGAAARAAGFTKVTVAAGDAAALAQLIKQTVRAEAGPLVHSCHLNETNAVTGMLINMGYAIRPLKLYRLNWVNQLPSALEQALTDKRIDAFVVLSVDEARAFTALIQQAEIEHLVKDWVVYATTTLASEPMRAVKVGRTVVASDPNLETLLSEFDQDVLAPPEPALEYEPKTKTEPEPDPIPNAPVPSAAADGATAQSKVTQRKRSGLSRFVIYFVLLILATAAAFGSLPWWYPRMPVLVQGWVPDVLKPPTGFSSDSVLADISTLQSRLATAENKITALRRDVTTIEPETVGDSSATQATVLGLQQRVAALEARPSSTSVAAVSSGTGEAALGNAVQLTDLSGRIESLEERSTDASAVSALTARITQVEAAAETLVNEQTSAIGFLLAVSQLQDAVQAGRSFELELETVIALATRTDGPDIDTNALAARAATGIAARAVLQREFSRIAPAVVRAGLLPGDSASWLQRTLDRLLSVVNIRRLDDDGSAAVGAVVTRIENAISDDDLASAITAAKSLSGLAAGTLAPWLKHIQDRATVENAVDRLNTLAIAQMAAGRTLKEAPATGD